MPVEGYVVLKICLLEDVFGRAYLGGGCGLLRLPDGVSVALVALVLAGLTACQFRPHGDGSTVSDAPAVDSTPDDAVTDSAAIDSALDAVALDAAIIDAIAIDTPNCPAVCTSCHADGTCQIDCGAGACGTGVTCPPGRPCVVNCVGDQACETGVVNCTLATSCQIMCVGTDACDAGVNCAGSSCSVTCQGTAACQDGGVDCTANVCSVSCSGTDACQSHVCCDGLSCGASCASSSGGCCSCNGC